MKTGQQQLSFLNILLISYTVGIFVAAWTMPPFLCLVSAGGILVLLAFAAIRKNSNQTWWIFSLLFLVAGALRFLSVSNLPLTDISFLAGEEIEICGEIIEEPRMEKSNRDIKVRYLLSAERVMDKKGARQASGKVYVYSLQEEKALADADVGDTIKVKGTVSKLHGYNNPGRVDTVLLAKAHGITARLYAGREKVSCEKNTGFIWRREVERVRRYYRYVMESVMPKEDAAAIFAMLFGGYAGIKPELTEAFTTTGIVHILSVSGSHISLLVTCISCFGRWLRLREWLIAAFAGLMIVTYCLIAGGVSPAVRAGIMGILAYIGQINGRERDAQRILTLTGLGFLFVSPLLLYDISFQLSFASVAGLLYISPILKEKLKKLPEMVAANLSITIGAQLAVFPIVVWYFNQVSLSSLAANIVVVPIVEFVIVIALAAGIIGGLLPATGKMIFVLASLLLGSVYELTRAISRLPLAAVYVPTWNKVICLMYYSGLILLLQKRAVHFEKKKLGSIAVIVLIVVGIGAGIYNLVKPKELAVHFIDVGQGDAALIVTPHGKGILIDSGGTRDNIYDIGKQVVVPYLMHYGVTELDTIYLTHVHADHAGGAGSVAHKLPVREIVTAHEGRSEYAKIMGLSYTDKVYFKLVTAREGEIREVDDVRIEMLFAPKVAAGTNEASNVIRVSYGNASFLFTGDLPKEKEEEVLRKCNPQSTVLKVAHHGSKTSTGDSFLAAVQPQFAVISVGAGNAFGHPNREILEKLSVRGIEISRTDRDGAVVFRTDGMRIKVEKYCQ